MIGHSSLGTMCKAIESIAEAVKALVSTLADRVKQWFAVRDTRKRVYADTAYNISILLETQGALGRNDIGSVGDLMRRFRKDTQNWEPTFSLLTEVNTVRSICERLHYLNSVSCWALERFPQELADTLAFVDSRIMNRELNKRRLLKVASAETREHIEDLFHKRPSRRAASR